MDRKTIIILVGVAIAVFITLMGLSFYLLLEDSKDKDGDGVLNEIDNCPNVLNSNQKDSDNDGVGDECDESICGNGVIENGEGCDGGDSCSNICQIEGNSPACSDGLDNDGDGYIDLNDWGCDDSLDNLERNDNVYECSDGFDNDNDGLIDRDDSNCADFKDDSEGGKSDGGGNEDDGDNNNGTCIFNSAIWNPELTRYGEQVKMEISGNYCNGELVNIFVKNELDDSIVDSKSGVVFVGDLLVIDWVVNDGTGQTGFAFIIPLVFGGALLIFSFIDIRRKIKRFSPKNKNLVILFLIVLMFLIGIFGYFQGNIPDLSPEKRYYFLVVLQDDSTTKIQSGGLGINGFGGFGFTECSDDIENDGDGWIDERDPGCWNEISDSGSYNPDIGNETNPSTGYECSDGFDNDNDGEIDGNDFDCGDSGDDDESGSSNNGWIILNGGNPVDSEDGFEGEGMPSNDLTGDRSIIDNNGNLIYFYYGSDPYLSINGVWRDLRVGRLTSDLRWEILGVNGWSSNNVNPVSFGGTLRHILAIKLFNSISGDNVFGLISSNPHIGAKGVDMHGGLSHFRSILGMEYWSNGIYTKHIGQSLLPNWGGALLNNFDIDFNDDQTIGILVMREKNNVDKPNNLIASRYEASSGEWKNWKSTGWTGIYSSSNPFARDYEFLPFYTDAEAAEPIPRVSNIHGSDQYVITYLDYQSSGISDMRAALYDDSESSWKVWDGNIWSSNYASSVAIFSGVGVSEIGNLKLRKRIKFKEDIYEFYRYVHEGFALIKMINYETSSQNWGVEIVMNESAELSSSEYGREVVEEDGNLLWVLYRNDSGIVLRTFDGAEWYDNGTVYESSTAYPYSLNFFNGLPVLLYIEEINGERRLFALSINGNSWVNQEIRGQRNIASERIMLDDGTGSEVAQWDIDVFYSDVSELGPGYCGHMAIDLENNVYCPGLPIFDDLVGIYPENYDSPENFADENAHVWIENWEGVDYFFGGVGGIAIDNVRGKAYVTDQLVQAVGAHLYPNSRIQIFEKDWNDENLVDGQYSSDKIIRINGERIAFASDVAVDEGNGFLYVAESGKDRIVKYDIINLLDGLPKLINFIGTGELNFPSGIDTDSSGNLYVVDSNNHRIVKYNPGGNKIGEFGNYGRGAGEFIYPYSVAIDKTKGYVYISDPYNRRLQILDNNGNFVYQFGEWQTNDLRYGVESFNHIGGIAVNDNNLYVGGYSQKSIPGPKEGIIVKFRMNLP